MADPFWPESLVHDLALRSDVVVTWVGAFGAVLFLRAARRAPGGSALHTRSEFLLAIFALMLFTRGFAWIWPEKAWVGVLFHVPATLQPIAMTVFVEGLLRRHLPRSLKGFIAGGTLAAFVGNIVSGIAGDPEWRAVFSIGFLGVLLLTMILLGVALVQRDRSTLSSSENALIRDVIVLAVVGTGLAATDFRDALGIAPVRAGTIAVLLLAFVLLSQPAGDSARRRVLVAATRHVLWGVGGGILITFVLGLSATSAIMATLVVSISLVLVVGIGNRAREIAHGADIEWLLRWLARPAPTTLVDLERALRHLPLTADAIVVSEPDLEAYHLEEVRRIAERAGPVISRSALRLPPEGKPDDALASDELADLLDRNEASHIGVLSVRPLRLLLVTLPEVPGSRGAEVALAAIMTHGARAAAHG